jgi:formylglycine-generating enzyme required for sulfatase activity
MSTKSVLNVIAPVWILACTATGEAQVIIETVSVGNPGNPGELSGEGVGGEGPDRICGRVDYVYRIGKFEVTAGQYTEFLNAVANEDPYGLYSTRMWTGTRGCDIERTGSSPHYSYSVSAEWANRPVNYVSWGDAARFCNWLHNGQPTGPQGPTTTEDGSYYLNGATSETALATVVRQPNATWVIPSEDEWYKAAYHYSDGVTANYCDYPTQSDMPPTAEAPPGTDTTNGSANYWIDTWIDLVHGTTEVGAYDAKPSDGPYGTFGQGGNVSEWNEAIIGSERGFRGGSWNSYVDQLHAEYRGHLHPTHESVTKGFRVAQVTEQIPVPAVAEWGIVAMALLLLTASKLVFRRPRAPQA